MSSDLAVIAATAMIAAISLDPGERAGRFEVSPAAR
jgi:hypothetical protein